MAYMVSGDPTYWRAINQAFRLLTAQQQYASGVWGPDEASVQLPQGQLGDSLTTTTNHFETPCGSYAATKLGRYLIRLTPGPSSTAHGDYLERALFNAILRVKRPGNEGVYFYYSNYTSRAEKVYYASEWPCCSGTLVQTVADYPLNIAFSTENGFYLNFYTPSTVSFTYRGADITLTLETEFPITDSIAIRLIFHESGALETLSPSHYHKPSMLSQ